MITKHEYFRWRENGVAFEAREGIYDRPNKSMASGVILKRVSLSTHQKKIDVKILKSVDRGSQLK